MRIKVSTPKYQYDFEIKRKVTVIRGDSGTGKTLLVDTINNLNEDVVQVQSEKRLIAAPYSLPTNISSWVASYPDSIVIVDENTKSGKSLEFLQAVLNAGCWLILITRGLRKRGIHYSVNEVYELHRSGKYITLKPFYEINKTRYNKHWQIVTEDSKSGYNFFKPIFNDVDSLHGRDNIVHRKGDTLYNKTFIIDGAAFGQLFDLYYDDYCLHKVDFSLLESFEWALLKSNLFSKDKYIKSVLENPEDYGANHVDYDTWENFFEWFLDDVMKMRGATGYSKSGSLRCFTENCCYKDKPCELLKSHIVDKKESILKLYGYVCDENSSIPSSLGSMYEGRIEL